MIIDMVGRLEEKIEHKRPKGDLISRSELKKEFAKFDRLYIADTGNELVNAFAVDKLINNAPTVKFSLLPADESKDEAYMRGYEKGKIEGFLRERSKGEWIEDGYRNLPCVCSYCGEEGNRTKFCPNCGAKMKQD